ncbi:MAG TPA: hypothetical protein VJV78_29310 [Polyangiales bacterium]|nr:hypothetical protein [Polyangiales bacterium]
MRSPTCSSLIFDALTRARSGRWFLHTPAALFLGQGTLIVALQPRAMLQTWQLLIDRINRSRFRIRWLDNRRMVLAIERNAVPDVRKLHSIRQHRP